MLHISDLKKYMKCPRFYHLDSGNDSFVPFLRMDESMSDLLKDFFNIVECFEGQVGDDNDRFLEAVAQSEWFIGARVNNGVIRSRIPLIHKTEEGLDVFFSVFNTSFREPDFLNYRISLDLLENLGFTVNRIFVVYVNGSYVYHDHLETDKLLLLTDTYKENSIIDAVRAYDTDYMAVADSLAASSLEDLKPVRCRFCKGHSICRFYKECFPEDEDLPDNSILSLVSSSEKNGLFEKGVTSLHEAADHIELSNRVQYAQVMADINGGLFADKVCLRDYLCSVASRPLVFLDFEWDTYLVPKYEGLRPLNVVCFEYALYVLREDGTLYHKCFIGEGDCRGDLITSLIADIPQGATVVAYNAKGAEVLRLRELAEQFPEYSEKLLVIAESFVDLAVPFTEGIVYHTAMRGNFTLKRLVDMVSDLSYKDLGISDGMKAVVSWRDIDKGNASASDRDTALRELEEYCSLDAYGLYLVYRWLLEVADETA